MKVIVTGAFGNVGESALLALLDREYEITCFDIKTKRNEKLSKKLLEKGPFKVIWGDITNIEDVKNALKDKDCIIHLAAIIPQMSEEKPELTKRVNIDGTRNLIEAAQELDHQPRFIFTSSISTHGPCMHRDPPRRADEELNPSDNYTSSKVECEKMLRESNLPWVIFRLAAVPPIKLELNRTMFAMARTLFDMPLEQRVEFVYTKDVGIALASAVTADAIHKTLLIGGGKESQMLARDFLSRTLGAYGLKMLPDIAFKIPKNDDDWFYTDWMDTEESQRILQFQNVSFDDFLEKTKKDLGKKKYLLKLVSPIAYWYLKRSSPYLKENKKNLESANGT